MTVRRTSSVEREEFLNSEQFHSALVTLFSGGDGYYRWSGLRYFLYEYELSLLSRQKGLVSFISSSCTDHANLFFGPTINPARFGNHFTVWHPEDPVKLCAAAQFGYNDFALGGLDRIGNNLTLFSLCSIRQV